jgi:hypothetical protein
MKNLFFWAQSLDNQTPDLIFKGGEELSDDLPRQGVISEIYKVPGQKKQLLSSNSEVSIRFSEPKFVLEIIPIEKDQMNRLAPVVIYGELPEDLSPDWVERSCTEIRDVVVHKLNRTLSRDAVPAIQKWFSSFLEEKKKKDERQKLSISLLIVLLVPVMVGWLLQANDIQPNLLQVSGLIALNNFLIMSLPTFLINRPRRKNRTT